MHVTADEHDEINDVTVANFNSKQLLNFLEFPANFPNFSFLEKRSSPPQQNATAPISSISELKGSPPAKKIVPRRLPSLVATPQEKSPLKGKGNRSEKQRQKTKTLLVI